MLVFVVLIVTLFVALTVGGAWWLAGFVMTGERQTYEQAMAWQSDRYDTSFFEALEKQAYTVSGVQGYQLHALLLKNPSHTNRYVILSHGYTDNRLGSLKYVPMYLDLGFNCIIYDLRGHGTNEPTFTTYGTLEGLDLSLVAQDARERFSDLDALGLHGESLGAASTIASLAHNPAVDFAVSDCAFSNIEDVLRAGYQNAGVPAFLFDVANFGSIIRYHYALKDMRPIDALDGSSVPTLFIHGEDDELIAPGHAIELFGHAQGTKELHLVAGAGHAESVLKSPEEYASTVRSFLEKLGVINSGTLT